MESGNEKETKEIAEKYKLQRSVGTINRIDGVSTGTYLSVENTKEIFSKDLSKPQFNSFDDGQTVTMIRTTPATAGTTAEVDKTKAEGDVAGLKNALAKKMMDTMLKQLEADTKIKINSSALQM